MRRGAIGFVIAAIAVAGLATVTLTTPAPTHVPADQRMTRLSAPSAATATAPAPSAAPSPAPRSPSATSAPHDAGAVIVRLKRRISASEAAVLGLGRTAPIRGALLVVAPAPKGQSAASFAAHLSASELVDYAEPDFTLQPAVAAPDYTSNPNDRDFQSREPWPAWVAPPDSAPAFPRSWALHGPGSSNFDKVWPALKTAKAGRGTDPDVRVAVIDTGFYFEGHTDLGTAAAIQPAIDECQFYWPDQPSAKRLTTDTVVTPVSASATGAINAAAAHGTFVASEIGQGTSNLMGSSGAAWDTRVDVYKIQGLQMSGEATGAVMMPDSALVKAIYDATSDAHAKGYRLVINLSLVEESGGGGSKTLPAAIAEARKQGVVIVAAAGNDSAGTVSYPAAYPGVISVGASAIDGDRVHRATFSNFGDGLDLLAPGEDIWGPVRPGTVKTLPGTITPDPLGVPGYDWASGTSMAAPYVSAAAALLLRVEPSLTATEVESYLAAGAVDMGASGRDTASGWGELDAYAAYRLLATPQTSTDARLAYADEATITLSVSDRNGVQGMRTFVQLDEGWDIAESTVVTTAQLGHHELSYWSVDVNGVTEQTRTVRFDVLEPDVVSPTTSVTVPASSSGHALIGFAASDPLPGWGPDYPIATRYRLDGAPTATVGPSGSVTVGSYGAHQLTYWSLDYAGNAETPKTATFTVSKLTTKVTIARGSSTIRRYAKVRLSGTLSRAISGDVVQIQYRAPGSRTWRNLTTAYRRTITSIDLAGRGTWPSLSTKLSHHGRYYFRAVWAGDTKTLSRTSSTSATTSVYVR